MLKLKNIVEICTDGWRIPKVKGACQDKSKMFLVISIHCMIHKDALVAKGISTGLNVHMSNDTCFIENYLKTSSYKQDCSLPEDFL